MKQTIRGAMMLSFLAFASVAATAGEIGVNGLGDNASINAATSGLVPLLDQPSGNNPTPGQCTLREALAIAQGAQIAATAADCLSNGNPRPNVYCPFYGNNNSTSGECNGTITGTVDAASADTIRFLAPSGRGTVQLVTALPPISTPVTIVGLGNNQSIITGNAAALATAFPPPNNGAATPKPAPTELTLVKISPDLPAGAEVRLESLAIRGVRVHYLRGDQPDADCGTEGDDCNAPYNAASSDRVINFGGILMSAGPVAGADRRKLSLKDVRMACHRRGLGSNVDLNGSALPDGGGAIAVFGGAELLAENATFSNNTAESGPGGAILAAARDGSSPQVTITNGRFDDDTTTLPACQDAVFATYSDVNAPVACGSTTGNTDLNSPCPQSADVVTRGTQLFTPYARGNFSGAVSGAGDLRRRAGSFAAIGDADDRAGTGGSGGGAIALDARAVQNLANAGGFTLTGSRFFDNQTSGNGGAIVLAGVGRSGTLPALVIRDTLFSSADTGTGAVGNRAAGDGGALFIVGNENQVPSQGILENVSFSFSQAGGRGGAFYFESRPGAPIDFSIRNARFGLNVAGGNGGAIYAQDNGVDDSGLLNISQATFDNNLALGDGGGVYCDATKSGSQFTNLTFSGNSADRGGGIYVGGRCHISINNSTIVDNTATTQGTGGLGANGGGGLFVPTATVNGRADVRNTVIAYNRSVDATSTTPRINASNGPDCSALDRAVLRSANFNFIGTEEGCGSGTTSDKRPFLADQTAVPGSSSLCLNNTTGDIVGSTRFSSCTPPLDPQVRVLSDNGGVEILGARSFTHHPENSSRLINNGASSGCRDGLNNAITVDQRGRFRGGSAGRCDIGAIEVGGGLTPQLGAVSVSSTTTNLPTSVTLPRSEQAVEMLRVSLTAPADQAISVKSMRIEPQDVSGGIPGSYASDDLVGLEVVVVNGAGQDQNNTLYSARRAALSGAQLTQYNNIIAGTAAIPFSSPVPIAPGSTVFVSVRFIFDGRQQQASLSSPAIYALAGGGLGAVSLLGLMGTGLRRRSRWGLAALLVTAAALSSGCSSDGGDGAIDEGARTYRIAAKQITFDTDAQQNVNQNISVIGETITVANPP